MITSPTLEPGLLEELQTRVEAAEQKFKAAELDDHLSEFEVARQRQVFFHFFNSRLWSPTNSYKTAFQNSLFILKRP